MTEGAREDASRRLFVGLAPPEDLARAVADAASEALGGSRDRALRLVPARDVHLTLCFLGSVLEAAIGPLEEALASEIAGASAPALSVTAAGAFPGPDRERVLWARVEDAHGAIGGGALDELRRRVVRAVERAGLAPDRQSIAEEFTAHLTLARVRGRTTVPTAFHGLRFDREWMPRAVFLFESRAGSGEPVRYPIRASFALGVQPPARS